MTLELGPVARAEKAEAEVERLQGALTRCWGEAYLLALGERSVWGATQEIISEAQRGLRVARSLPSEDE